jgi:hypothetical protein
MSTRRRALAFAALAIGLVVAIGWVVFRDTTTPVEADVVQSHFDGVVGSSPGEPGVYRYRTTGFEEVDAFSGGRHQYPAETFMTITISECGPVVRWHALAERWIDWEHCGLDLGVTASSTYHEWFGIPDLEEEICVEPRRITGEAGELTTTVCGTAETLETYETTIIGQEVLDVGGVPIETTHLRRTSSLSRGSSGTAAVEVWRVTGTALMVRMEVSRRSVTPSAIGDVAYMEEFTLDLVALTPEA